jgi:hypothetical protein
MQLTIIASPQGFIPIAPDTFKLAYPPNKIDLKFTGQTPVLPANKAVFLYNQQLLFPADILT